MIKSKLGWVLVGTIVGTVIGATTIIAGSDDPEVPVSAEGMLVEAAFNTDWQQPGNAGQREELEKVIEGSCSFKVDVQLSKIRKHMEDAGTWGKISPNVSDYTATKVTESETETVYKISETINPTAIKAINKLAASKLNLLVTINKRAAKEDAVVVRWTLDTAGEQGFGRFNGRVFAADLHTGKSMVLITTSSKSNYKGIPDRLRLKLVEHYLAKTKDQILVWLKSL